MTRLGNRGDVIWNLFEKLARDPRPSGRWTHRVGTRVTRRVFAAMPSVNCVVEMKLALKLALTSPHFSDGCFTVPL